MPAVYTPEQLAEIPIRAAFTPDTNNRQIGNTLAANGSPLRVRDVAEVMFDYAPPIGDAIINNRPGMLLIVEKQPWANTLDVTRLVEKAMSDLNPPWAKWNTTQHIPTSDVY